MSSAPAATSPPPKKAQPDHDRHRPRPNHRHSRPGGPARQPPVLPNLLRSEWARIFSVRSTYRSLAVAAAALIGYGAINSASHTGAPHATFNPILASLSGVLLAQLAIAVLGVLVITTEYSTGMIRSTFAAAPQRQSVIVAKAGVFGAVAFTAGTVASLIAFLAGQAMFALYAAAALTIALVLIRRRDA